MRSAIVLAALALPLALGACKKEHAQTDYTAAPGPAAIGDVLNSALTASPANLVPYLAADTAASAIAGDIYQAMISYDKNLNLVPELAESFTVSPDGLHITFKLKKGLTFSDSSPLTSRDVSATFHALINPETKTPYADDYLRVSKFETPDPLTVRVSYKEAFAPGLSSWAGLIVMPAKVIAQTKSFNDTKLKDQPLGSGPYALTRWRRGQDVLLTRNPSSTKAPFIAQQYLRILPDQSTQWLEMKAGNLDTAPLTPLAYTRLTDADWFKNNYATYRYLSSAYTYLGFNLKDPLFADKRVRQALSYAVDRQGLINAALFGQGEPLASIFKTGTWAYNTSIEPYPFNPEKARDLLKQAGWTMGKNGVLVNSKGEEFRFTLSTNQGNEVRLKTAQILQKFFADVGIVMDIRVQEWSTFLTNTVQQRKFQTLLMGWTLPAEPDPYDVWHSSKTAPAEFNIISFNNKEADAAIVASRSTFVQAERKKHLDRLQEILHDEQPYLWLYAPYALEAVHKRIVGIQPAPAGISYNFDEWYVPKNWQLRPLLVQ
ncbi:MAG: peptide-binding protein [Blastochloris viridis]|uniref:Peptide-binding protein n=1 Tax=Blastochloris viridis TaxID=1079 RepID=A0A6N4R462_BLAVI|nr:MAG: peptide-binding protein [Blastochloris viridis]